VGAWTSGRLNLRGLWSMAGDEVGIVGIVLGSVCADVQTCSLNDGYTFREMRRYAISSLCERHSVYFHKPR